MLILGINAFHADASAAIICDGEVKFAIAEERLNRIKHYAGFPALSIQACLDYVGAKMTDVDHVAIGQDSNANITKKLQYALTRPANLLNFVQLRERKRTMNNLRSLFVTHLQVDPAALRFHDHHVEHHIAHIASAYYCSPWEEAAGFSYDGSGDFVSAMSAACAGNKIEVKHRTYLPDSLGSFYTMVSEYIGYNQYGDEGKVMGLAPYGSDTHCDLLSKMAPLSNGHFQLDLSYFKPLGSSAGMQLSSNGTVQLARHYSDRMCRLFGAAREAGSEITQREKDLAYGVQHCFEEAFFHCLETLHEAVPQDNLVMAGGCALNSVANGKIFERTPFRQTWIQPAAGDEGLAIGAALYAYHHTLGQLRQHEMKHSYLGPEFSEQEIEGALKAAEVGFRKVDRQSLLHSVADRIAAGDVVGWFQGRMEWGPRALGNRSILAHPGLSGMKDVLNSRIKNREWFRPFAPSILVERQSEYFEHDHPSPFMLHVYKIRAEKRDQLCAVNHVDNTGRLQTVSREENSLYYDLIKAFEEKTGIPVLLNTSFNENEPIVCTPKEAIECFKRTRMDLLAIGPYIVDKLKS